MNIQKIHLINVWYYILVLPKMTSRWQTFTKNVFRADFWTR